MLAAFDRERQNRGDGGAVIRARSDLQPSTGLPQALAHSRDSNTEQSVRLESRGSREPAAMVFDPQDETIGLPSQMDRGRLAAGMTVDVDQALLNDAKQIGLDVFAKALDLLRDHQVDFDTAPLGVPVDIPLQ